MERLEAWLTQLHRDGQGFSTFGASLPELPDQTSIAQSTPDLPSLQIYLEPDGVFEGKDAKIVQSTQELEAGRADALIDHLARSREFHVATGKALPPKAGFTLIADRSARWDAFVTLANALTADGYGPLHIVLAAPSELTTPQTRLNPLFDWFRERLDASKTGQIVNPLTVVSAHAHVFADCSEVPRRIEARFAAMHAGREDYSVPSEKIFREETISGLRECDCNVHIEEIKTFAWARMGRFQGPPFRAIELRLSKTAANAIQLPRAQPWGRGVPQLREAAERKTPIQLLID